MMVFRDGRYAVMCDIPGCFEVGVTDVSTDEIREETPLPTGWTGLRTEVGGKSRGGEWIPEMAEAHGCPIHPLYMVAPGQSLRMAMTSTVS